MLRVQPIATELSRATATHERILARVRHLVPLPIAGVHEPLRTVPAAERSFLRVHLQVLLQLRLSFVLLVTVWTHRVVRVGVDALVDAQVRLPVKPYPARLANFALLLVQQCVHLKVLGALEASATLPAHVLLFRAVLFDFVRFKLCGGSKASVTRATPVPERFEIGRAHV